MKKLLAVVAAIALLGVSCNKTTPIETNQEKTETTPTQSSAEQENQNQPLHYDMEGMNVVEQRSLLLVRRTFLVPTLIAQSAECGTNLTSVHFSDILRRFENQRGHRYDFIFQDATQDPKTYSLFAFPNGPGYANFDAFRQDFNVCHSGEALYPLDLNDDWLVFESGCGSGLDDGSGRPMGCDLIRRQITQTLEIQ